MFSFKMCCLLLFIFYIYLKYCGFNAHNLIDYCFYIMSKSEDNLTLSIINMIPSRKLKY